MKYNDTVVFLHLMIKKNNFAVKFDIDVTCQCHFTKTSIIPLI